MRTWARLTLLAVILATALPRLLALDRFVTIDEPLWLTNSGNFYRALSRGEFAGTFQNEHPGVTVMWAGTAAFLWSDPTYARAAPRAFRQLGEIEPFLEGRGRRPLDILVAGRVGVVAASVASLGVALLAAVRLIGLPAAVVGFTLIAFDPFHLALSRLFHSDGLLASLMLLSLLAFLNYVYGGRRRGDLAVSAVSAGLACLTKAPALALFPFGAWLLLAHTLADARPPAVLRRALAPFAAWVGGAAIVCVMLWPVLWVSAYHLVYLFLKLGYYGTLGHFVPIFFDGAIHMGDPGPRFYPITYAWRTTPIVLGGLLLAALTLTRPHAAERERRRIAAVLVGFALAFALLMTLSAKKFDRYLLPAHLPLDLVSGMGWVAAGERLGRRRPLLSPAAMGAAMALQALGTLPTAPYFLTYYNPLLGGGARAPAVMMVGWGEGLDEAARYLNARGRGRDLRALSWYSIGPFSYFFRGRTFHFDGAWDPTKAAEVAQSDYVVLYVNQWQRRMLPRELLSILADRPLERSVTLNGIEYVRIYRVRETTGAAGVGPGRR